MKLRLFLRLVRESAVFSMGALISNKLRTFLSLLGVTIGIFAIITVFTIVDSMESSIRTSIESLGDDVLFVQKWPWSFGSDYPWWKYWNRPQPTIDETFEIKRRITTADASVFVVNTQKTIEFEANSMTNTNITGSSNEYEKVRNFEISEGRFISDAEFSSGKNVVVIGNNIVENLFDKYNPIGKSLKIFGRKVEVIGLFKKEGSNTFGESMDDAVVIPVNFLRNFVDIKGQRTNPTIMVKAKVGVSNEELRDELVGLLRSLRKLKPITEDNFAINETSLLTKNFDGLFVVISIAGWFIGGLSILVGGFGIANIMFVSVKERTGIIGIQKSLGAKNYFIMFQFLFEAIILSLLGGALGLLLIYIGTTIVSSTLDFNLNLTLGNILWGFSISAIVGLFSGIIPAYVASKLDPVEAMRVGQ
ncbi:MAG: ABC transporter permease [Bacteroidota bacterium]